MSVQKGSGALHLGTDADVHVPELRKLVDDIGRRSFEERLGSRRLPEQFDEKLWRTLEAAGLTAMTSTPDLEAGPFELAIVLSSLARHAGAVPIAETDLLAMWLAHQAGLAPPAGALTIAIADADTSGGRIRGTAFDAPWTREAAAVVLAARVQGSLRVGLLAAGDLDIDDGHNLAGEPRDTLSFDLPNEQFTVLEESIGDELVLRAAWARCVQIVGALEGAAEQAVAHTRQRVQFGRALADFQSVQHSLALMTGEIERTRAAVALAVAAAGDAGFTAERTRFAVSVAKVVLGETVSAVNTIAHQLHGAIGVTIEHPLWLYTMRAQSWVAEFGTPRHYARQLGHFALTAENPWDVVIDGSAICRRHDNCC